MRIPPCRPQVHACDVAEGGRGPPYSAALADVWCVRAGLVHALWHADFAQRRSSAVARDMISNLRDMISKGELASEITPEIAAEIAPASSTPPRRRARTNPALPP